MSYQAILTDSGLEIRDENETVIWGPSESYSWPPNEEMLNAVLEDANISDPNKAVFKVMLGLVEIKDETTTEAD